MAPLHHHFELGGMPETRVVAMYYIGTVLLCLLALLGFTVYGRALRKGDEPSGAVPFLGYIRTKRRSLWRFEKRWCWAWRAAARPAARLLLARGCEVTICDQKAREAFKGALDDLDVLGVHWHLGEENPLPLLEGMDALILSPRHPRYASRRCPRPRIGRGGDGANWNTPTANPQGFCWP